MADPEQLIPLEDLAEYLKVDPADVVLPGLLAAAISHIDGPRGWLGRAIVPQTLTRRFGSFGSSELRLPYPPVIEVTGVEYKGPAGSWETLPNTGYAVTAEGIEPSASTPLPFSDDWRVTWRAGYDGADDRKLPDAIRTALLLMVAYLYRNREDTDLPTTGAAAALLRPYVVYR